MPPSVAAPPAPRTSPPSPAYWTIGSTLPRTAATLRSETKYPRPEAAILHQCGLRTPPAEDMGTTYQAPAIAPYESHSHASIPGYSAAMAHVDRTRTALSDAQAVLDGYSRYSSSQNRLPTARPQLQAPQQQLNSQQQQNPQQALPAYQPQQISSSSSRPAISASQTLSSQSSSSRQGSRTATPRSNRSMASQGAVSQTEAANLANQSSEIPICISPKGGSLSDFAAQMTCFFWCESRKTHQLAEQMEVGASSEPIRRLNQNAIPCQNFKSWVHGILSTTQVTQNVIILALLYIHRLKVGNPNVKGRPGSEYRLLTVALMLGNKFLDDNTYTNKTWAEVSGISVGEIHVMEVEFLSNMRYSLFVSVEQWEEWLVKLAKFWQYCEAALRPTPSPTPAPILIPSPTHFPVANSPLPSPTGNVLLTPSAHPTPAISGGSAYSPGYGHSTAPAAQWPTPLANQALSPLFAKTDVRNGFGKRSFTEDDPTEPPAKRAIRHPHAFPSQHLSQINNGNQARQAAAAGAIPIEPLRLPVPNLTLNTVPQLPSTATPYAPPSTTHAPAQQSSLSLPPLVPGMRAMATVYPPANTTTSSYSPTGLVAANGPAANLSSVVVPCSVSTPLVSKPPSGFPLTTNYGTPTKRHSPGSLTPAAAAALGNSSPLTDSFSHTTHSGVLTPISHSPSVYLQHRASPYRPVRHVNTLLYPPPSASLHEYHLSGQGMIQPTQMHYQPLGHRNVFHTGIVPEFIARHQPQQQQQPSQHQYARQGASLTPGSRPGLSLQHPQSQPQRSLLGPTQGQQPHGQYPN